MPGENLRHAELHRDTIAAFGRFPWRNAALGRPSTPEEQALLDAGDLAGAGLDVFEHEPAVNPKLARLARDGKVVLLPHMGSATVEGRLEMGEKVIINIKTFADGHRPPDLVLPGML